MGLIGEQLVRSVHSLQRVKESWVLAEKFSLELLNQPLLNFVNSFSLKVSNNLNEIFKKFKETFENN